MVICKFYLQGTCKFGESCKFEHQGNDANHGISTSILRQQTFPGMANTNNANNVDTNTLIHSVQNDMLNTEKGGQWLLSSYAPFKDKPAFPGFEDRSFEEVRLGFYEAKGIGTVEQYKQQLQMLLQDAIAKIKVLQNPSPEIINVIKDIYNSAPKSSLGQQQSSFPSPANPAQNMGFPSSTLQSNYNYNNQPSNSIFAQSNQNAPAPVAQNIFAAANQKLFPQPTSIFTNNPPNSNNFSSNNAFAQPNTMFASQQQPMQNSIFNSQQMPQSSIFNQPPAATNPIFNVSSASQFSGTAQPPQPQPQQTSVFNNNMQTSSAFNNNIPEQKSLFTQPSNANYAAFQQTPPFSQSSATNSPLSNALFAPAANPQQQNAFLNPQPTFLQTQTQNPGAFAQQVNPPLYMQPGVFSLPPPQNVQINPHSSSSMIGKPTTNLINQPQSIFRTIPNAAPDQSAYSRREDLSELEIKAFQANMFEFGQIPEKPPTSEMCNY